MSIEIRCTKCGEVLTAPVYFESKPYGWSCIKKVCPTYKKPKTIKTFISDLDVKKVIPYNRPNCYIVFDKNGSIVGDPATTEKVTGGFIYYPTKK